jgi:hypothetical protein
MLGISPRQAAVAAAERRAHDNRWCPTAAIAAGQEVVINMLSDDDDPAAGGSLPSQAPEHGCETDVRPTAKQPCRPSSKQVITSGTAGEAESAPANFAKSTRPPKAAEEPHAGVVKRFKVSSSASASVCGSNQGLVHNRGAAYEHEAASASYSDASVWWRSGSKLCQVPSVLKALRRSHSHSGDDGKAGQASGLARICRCNPALCEHVSSDNTDLRCTSCIMEAAPCKRGAASSNVIVTNKDSQMGIKVARNNPGFLADIASEGDTCPSVQGSKAMQSKLQPAKQAGEVIDLC